MGQQTEDGISTTAPKLAVNQNDSIDQLAGAAWTAYSASVGGKSVVTGDALPTWAALKANPDRTAVVQGWRAAVQAILSLNRPVDKSARANALVVSTLEKTKNCINALLSNGGAAVSDEFGDKCRAIIQEAREVLSAVDYVDNSAPVSEIELSAGATTPSDQNLAAQTGI